jgi:alkylmercury lyase
MTTDAYHAMDDLLGAGGLPGFEGDRPQLLVRVLEHLAQAHPVTANDVSAMVADLELGPEEAREWLEPRTEHDAQHDIVGFGLTLNQTPHRFTTRAPGVFAWCALDTLIFAILLDQTAQVESTSPESGAVTRLVVRPDGIADVTPAEAVITLPVVDDSADTSTVEAIWATFCHRSYFFPSRAEAERWANGNDGIEVASLDDGLTLARRLAAAFVS